MFEQMQNPVFNYNKTLVETALKVNGLALETATRAIDVQVKTVEKRWNATQAFLTEATDARNMDDMKALWPKGFNLVKETTEAFVATSQELFGLAVKSGETVNTLIKKNFEVANDTVTQTVQNTVKATAKKAK